MVFDSCEGELVGATLFIDNTDARGARDWTRPMLSLDFQGQSKTQLNYAIKRPQDLGPAQLSRFDLIIRCRLPSPSTRRAELRRCAEPCTDDTREQRAAGEASTSVSDQHIKEGCEQIERSWRGLAQPAQERGWTICSL